MITTLKLTLLTADIDADTDADAANAADAADAPVALTPSSRLMLTLKRMLMLRPALKNKTTSSAGVLWGDRRYACRAADATDATDTPCCACVHGQPHAHAHTHRLTHTDRNKHT